MSGFGPLVEASWLAQHLDDADLRVIDFRWYLNHETGEATSGCQAYEESHIPGAAFVDLEEVSGHTRGAGRHPLPEAEVFQREMRRAGVSHPSRVVVYDDEGGLAASRLWWTLRYFGHDAVAVLDGGLPTWSGPLRSGHESIPEGDFRAAAQPEMKVDFEEVRRLVGKVRLFDARRKARYLGEHEPIEPRAGHIPGAISAYWRDNLTTDGRFRRPEELLTRYAALDLQEDDEAVSYCASGVSACHNLLAMELAGFRGTRLYPGSWSDWSRRVEAPVAVGDESQTA